MLKLIVSLALLRVSQCYVPALGVAVRPFARRAVFSPLLSAAQGSPLLGSLPPYPSGTASDDIVSRGVTFDVEIAMSQDAA